MDHRPRPRVVVAEDHAELLEKVALLLATEFEVVAKVRDGASAFQSAIDSDPDVLLLDLYIPEMNGLEVVRALRKRRARTVTLIMSGSDDIEMVEAAMAAGATSFVSKSRLGSELLSAVRRAAQHVGDPHGEMRG